MLRASTKDVSFEDSPVKTEESSKRPREDGAEESAAKKVDTKSDGPASNGNKRAREDDASEEKPAKKVDVKSDS